MHNNNKTCSPVETIGKSKAKEMWECVREKVKGSASEERRGKWKKECIRYGVVVNISVSHMLASGLIPDVGIFLFFLPPLSPLFISFHSFTHIHTHSRIHTHTLPLLFIIFYLFTPSFLPLACYFKMLHFFLFFFALRILLSLFPPLGLQWQCASTNCTWCDNQFTHIYIRINEWNETKD